MQNTLLDLTFSSNVKYNWCGKFVADDASWTHIKRELHDFELFLVLEGTLYISDGIHNHEIMPGHFLIMPSTPTQYGTQPSSCSFYWMHFDFLKDTISPESPIFSQNTLPLFGTILKPDRIVLLIHELQDISKRYHDPVVSNLLCLNVLLEITNQNRQVQATPKEASLLGKERLIAAIDDYIFWNQYKNIQIPELADYFGYHEKYISSLYKKNTGMTLKEKIIKEKMIRAKAELMKSEKKISQIAYDLGYSDCHNFSNAFKKIYGISPNHFRENFFQVPKIP